MAGQSIDSSGILHGDQNFSLPFHMNYGKTFLDRILKFKDKVAMINGATKEQITFGEMSQQIVNTAASLARLGVKRGDVVAICSDNRAEFLITTVAVLCAGAVVTFINSAYTLDELFHSMNISKPRYVFFSPDAYKSHFDALMKIKIVRRFFIYENKTSNKTKAMCFSDLATAFTDINSYRFEHFYGKSETAMILYSSGTTGLHKGAKLTHLNLIISEQQPEPCPRDVPVLTVAPWCNCMGIITTTRALAHGKTVVFLPKFEEKTYLQTIEMYKPGLLIVVPPLIIVLCKSTILDKFDVGSVETMHSGGAPLDPDTITQVKKRFRNLVHVLQGYGMTETTGALTEELESVTKEGSVGKIIPGNIVKIVDIEHRNILGANEPGEVCVKGPVLFDGYIGKPSELDEDGFYKTGDIAYYDEQGFFYVVDRLKELIKYKAWQVPPSELEAILLQHSAVKDVGVIGTADRTAGEVPTAFVVKQPQAKADEKELIDFVASKVSPWKQLRGGVRFIGEIPKNGSGKILRRKLRELLNKGPASKL